MELISWALTSFHLQISFFQIKWVSQVPGVRTCSYFFKPTVRTMLSLQFKKLFYYKMQNKRLLLPSSGSDSVLLLRARGKGGAGWGTKIPHALRPKEGKNTKRKQIIVIPWVYDECQDSFFSDLISHNYSQLTGLQPHSLLADLQTFQVGPLLCSQGWGFSTSRCYKLLNQIHLSLCLMLFLWRGFSLL